LGDKFWLVQLLWIQQITGLCKKQAGEFSGTKIAKSKLSGTVFLALSSYSSEKSPSWKLGEAKKPSVPPEGIRLPSNTP
jgi:hypothetical protein